MIILYENLVDSKKKREVLQMDHKTDIRLVFISIYMIKVKKEDLKGLKSNDWVKYFHKNDESKALIRSKGLRRLLSFFLCDFKSLTYK